MSDKNMRSLADLDATEPNCASDSTPEDSDFRLLIQAAKSGDDSAIEQLWNHCRRYLLTIANNDLGTVARQKFGASDVVQQSMIIAHEKLPTFQGSTKAEFFAWMKQVVLFECKQATRRFQGTQKRAAHREMSMTEDSATSRGTLQIRDPQLTPSTLASDHEQAELVLGALSELKLKEQQVIRLRNWEELSFEAIGERLGKSAEATRKLWSRAIAALERELKRRNAI